MRSPSDAAVDGSAGFTLLELLLVLVLMGLVLGVVAPRLGTGSAALAADARTLSAALTLARTQAVSSGREALFTLEPATRRWAVPEAGRTGTLPGGTAMTVTVDGAEAAPDRVAVRFMPDGASSGGRFTLHADGARRVVTVDWLTGRVAIDALP